MINLYACYFPPKYLQKDKEIPLKLFRLVDYVTSNVAQKRRDHTKKILFETPYQPIPCDTFFRKFPQKVAF